MKSDINLRVEESPVKSGGRSRINQKTLEKLNIAEGESVVLRSNHKDILVTIYSDDLIEEGGIKVRQQDLKKLSVKEGDEIKIKKHQSLLTNLL